MVNYNDMLYHCPRKSNGSQGWLMWQHILSLEGVTENIICGF